MATFPTTTIPKISTFLDDKYKERVKGLRKTCAHSHVWTTVRTTINHLILKVNLHF